MLKPYQDKFRSFIKTQETNLFNTSFINNNDTMGNFNAGNIDEAGAKSK